MMFTMKMYAPTDSMISAVKIAAAAVKKLTEVNQKIEALGDESTALREHGEKGVELWQQKQKDLVQEYARIEAEAVQKLQDAEQEASTFLNRQFAIDGAVLRGDDALALNAGVVKTAEELAEIAARNADSFTLLRMCAAYAERYGLEWAFSDKSIAVRDYTENLFKGLRTAVNVPDGIASMQYLQTENEFARIANNYGILDCFGDDAFREMETAAGLTGESTAAE